MHRVVIVFFIEFTSFWLEITGSHPKSEQSKKHKFWLLFIQRGNFVSSHNDEDWGLKVLNGALFFVQLGKVKNNNALNTTNLMFLQKFIHFIKVDSIICRFSMFISSFQPISHNPPCWMEYYTVVFSLSQVVTLKKKVIIEYTSIAFCMMAEGRYNLHNNIFKTMRPHQNNSSQVIKGHTREANYLRTFLS